MLIQIRADELAELIKNKISYQFDIPVERIENIDYGTGLPNVINVSVNLIEPIVED